MHNSLVFKGGEAMYGRQCGNDRLDHVVKQMSISGQQKHTGIVTLVTRKATLMNNCFKSCISLQFLHKNSLGHPEVLKITAISTKRQILNTKKVQQPTGGTGFDSD